MRAVLEAPLEAVDRTRTSRIGESKAWHIVEIRQDNNRKNARGGLLLRGRFGFQFAFRLQFHRFDVADEAG